MIAHVYTKITLAATSKKPGLQAIGSWAQVPLGTLGTQATPSKKPDLQAIGSWA